jgi:hypothetical protein
VTYPHTPQPGPRPVPPPGGFRPGAAPAPAEPTDADNAEFDNADRGNADRGNADRGNADRGNADRGNADRGNADRDDADFDGQRPAVPSAVGGTGHPAVDAVLRSLANAAPLAPADQIAEYEAAHRVLQETLTSIDG